MSTDSDRNDENVRVISDWLDALMSLDPRRLRACWADDATIDFVYTPDGFPSHFSTSQQIDDLAEMFCGAVKRLAFHDVRVEPLLEGDRVLVEFKGDGQLHNGNPYRNTYIGVFEVRDGKIQRHREFFDPNVVAEAFGLSAAS